MKRIAIIGAGIAGINAGLHLADKGIRPDIFETKSGVGGRLFSFTDKITGDKIDNGQHLMMGAYKETIKLINRLDADKYLTVMNNLELPVFEENGKKHLLKTRLGIKHLDILDAFLKFGLSKKSILSLLRFLKDYKLNPALFKSKSVSEILRLTKQTDEIIKLFWEPLTLATLNQKTQNAPASLLKTVLDKAFFSDRESGKFVFCNSGLSHLFINFESEFTQLGGKLILGGNVRSVSRNENSKFTIHTADKVYDGYDMIISAVPPHVLSKILGNGNLAATVPDLDKFSYSTIVSLYLWLSEDIIPDLMAGMTGTSFHWLFNKRKMQNSSTGFNAAYPYHFTLTASCSATMANLDEDEILTICKNDIKSCFGVDISNSLLHHRLIKDHFATIVQSPEIEKYRPDTITPVEGFLVAGDWTRTGLPATIESAAVSGRKAAEATKLN